MEQCEKNRDGDKMSPICNDYNPEEAMEKATKELAILLEDMISGTCYEVVLNTDRKFWQFWKPKTKLKAIEQAVKDEL